jgi:hypothetical protein
MKKRWGLALLLFVCLFAQAMSHARNASITFDEGPHLAVGYTTLRTGDLRLQPVHIHPPLANVMAAAPLLLQSDLPDPRTVSGWEVASLSAVTDAVVWQYAQPRRMALLSRFPIILMTLLLAAIVYRWASDLFGPRAGLLALALLAFDPNIIAHGSLVTTDMAVTLLGTAALFLTARALRRPRRSTWAGAAVAVGMALSAKVSAVALLPIVAGLWLLFPRGLSLKQRILGTLGGVALVGFVLWAAYGFELRTLPGIPFPVPAATHLEIYFSLQEHYYLGHPTFLLGRNATHGWPTYFPIAFLLKTPLPTLLLLATSLLYSLATLFRRALAPLRPCPPGTLVLRDLAPLLLYPLLYLASSLFSSVNIGYRHLLPVLPVMYIGISRIVNCELGVANLRVDFLIRSSKFAILAILIWLIAGTTLVTPNCIAFFNPLAGGPDGGYRYLVDSNLDWGQNLWQLRDWMAENDVGRVYYAHYSPARPTVYGVDADFLPPDPRAVDFAPFDPAPGVYAIGATVLQGPYAPDINTFAWFRTHEPVARLGNALFVYEVEPRPEPTGAAICADPAPVIAADAARDALGRSDLRVATFDCAQSWVDPSGDGPSTLFLPPSTAAPPGAVLEVETRHADGTPGYRIYRINLDGLGADALVQSIDGPLHLLGGRWGTNALRGEISELWTVWQVESVPARPLSLMAHLIGPDGATVAVGDGLGFSIEQWQVGDIIVQRHRFPIPGDAPPGPYSVVAGAYWLDTMERWPIALADGTNTDQVMMGGFSLP